MSTRILLSVLLLALIIFFASEFLIEMQNREILQEPEAASALDELRTKISSERAQKSELQGTPTEEENIPEPQQTPKTEPSQAPETTSDVKPTPNLIKTPPPAPAFTDQEFYDRFSGAIIQIFCLSPDQLFSASGVIVNNRGLVLTNAHVAEIMERVGAKHCEARHGNPAETFAKLSVVFRANTSEKISGTEVPKKDIAFLKLESPTAAFSAADLGFQDARRNEALFTLGYPSEFLQALATSAHSNLVFSKLAPSGLTDLDGDTNAPDGYIFRGGIILQQGSSGTGLFTGDGKIAGIIFATTKSKTTDEREGVALMSSYIDRILLDETSRGLAEFIDEH